MAASHCTDVASDVGFYAAMLLSRQHSEELKDMRVLSAFVTMICVFLVANSSWAHGPQIQITNDNGKIVTREIIGDGPYYESLTAPTLAYVMPLKEVSGVWVGRPNTAVDPITSAPLFPAGPGLAYGYDLADGGPQAFAEGSVLSVSFTAGLKKWDGAAFVDAGVSQAKGYRGSNAAISTPAENFAVSSDVAPFDSLSLPAVAAGYGADGPEVHNSLRWAILGDGSSSTSPVADGIYLLSLQLSSTQTNLAASDPYYFVVHKNASITSVTEAVNSLGLAANRIQVVPEPMSAVGVGLVLVGLSLRRHRRA